jgi:hypothetical protein
MKAIIAVLALTGLFSTQAMAAKSCGQMIEAKSEAKATIAYLTSKIKDSNNADKIAELSEQRAELVDYVARLNATINDVCKADYND